MAKTTKTVKKAKQLPITGVRIEPEVLKRLYEIKEETGAPISAQVRIALMRYLEWKGKAPERK